jgi:hypothetical protein
MIYLLIVYLDFPYLFYGRKCCNLKGFGHFFFSPVTGIWFPNVRRLFYATFGFLFLVNVVSVLLVLMWIALGVVVNPTLAIPYATGIIVFFSNLINVKNSIMNWQNLVIDDVLERLSSFLKTYMDSNGIVEPYKKMLTSTRDALMEQSKSDSADGSNMTPLLNVLNGLAENNFGINGFTIRKLKESEVALLLRSFWLSIREELGLTQRNLFIAVISSSLVLGLLLLFIFIGTSALNIFSK